jgi:hypothetical protein
MPSSALAVFTAKSVDRLLREGGTKAWVLDAAKARRCEFAVCTKNRFNAESEGTEPHRSAFLVGRIADVVPAPGEPGRWLVRFSEYALVDVPNAWEGWRNPVRYTSLEDLKIDVATLDFRPMPEPASSPRPEANPRSSTGLTIAEAKAGLALSFGVPPEAVEITIRG